MSEPHDMQMYYRGQPLHRIIFPSKEKVYTMEECAKACESGIRQGVPDRLFFQNIMSHGFNSILNIGCDADPACLDSYDNVTQFDLNDMEERYGIKFKHFVRGNAYKLPFPDKSYDVCVMGDIIEHLTNPTEAIAEALRVASKRLVCSIPSEEYDLTIAWPEHRALAEARIRTLLREKYDVRTDGLSELEIFDLARKHSIKDVALDHINRFNDINIKELFPQPNAEIIHVKRETEWMGYLVVVSL